MFNYSKEDFKLADQYVRIAKGMDSIYKNDLEDNELSFSKEGLLPIQLSDLPPLEITGWKEAVTELEKLENEYSHFPVNFRSVYMLDQLNSTKNLAMYLENKKYHFREQVQHFLKVDENPIPDEEIKLSFLRLNKLFDKQNIDGGKVGERAYAWETSNLVKDIKQVGDQYLELSKSEVLNKGFNEIEDVSVGFEVVHDVPYNAYCDFEHNTIFVNGDLSYTSFQLKHLAVHESFPGHTTHMTIREKLLREEKIPSDASLVFTNTASSSIFEGIGDNGLRLLGWDKSADDEIFHELQLLRSKVALNASYKLNFQKKSKEEVISYLINFGLADENWANSRFRFISHHFRAPFIYSYWRGQEAVGSFMDGIEEENYSKFYRFLLENMNSAKSMKFYKEELVNE